MVSTITLNCPCCNSGQCPCNSEFCGYWYTAFTFTLEGVTYNGCGCCGGYNRTVTLQQNAGAPNLGCEWVDTGSNLPCNACTNPGGQWVLTLDPGPGTGPTLGWYLNFSASDQQVTYFYFGIIWGDGPFQFALESAPAGSCNFPATLLLYPNSTSVLCNTPGCVTWPLNLQKQYTFTMSGASSWNGECSTCCTPYNRTVVLEFAPGLQGNGASLTEYAYYYWLELGSQSSYCEQTETFAECRSTPAFPATSWSLALEAVLPGCNNTEWVLGIQGALYYYSGPLSGPGPWTFYYGGPLTNEFISTLGCNFPSTIDLYPVGPQFQYCMPTQVAGCAQGSNTLSNYPPPSTIFYVTGGPQCGGGGSGTPCPCDTNTSVALTYDSTMQWWSGSGNLSCGVSGTFYFFSQVQDCANSCSWELVVEYECDGLITFLCLTGNNCNAFLPPNCSNPFVLSYFECPIAGDVPTPVTNFNCACPGHTCGGAGWDLFLDITT
jgi:hypothetical protein